MRITQNQIKSGVVIKKRKSRGRNDPEQMIEMRFGGDHEYDFRENHQSIYLCW